MGKKSEVYMLKMVNQDQVQGAPFSRSSYENAREKISEKLFFLSTFWSFFSF